MSDDIVYPSPEEWVAYLREPGRLKATGQFADGEGRCCLGHYADMCGLTYENEQPIFRLASVPGVRLPRDHWLLALVSDDDRLQHQDRLADINDSTDGFDSVLAYIEDHLVGKV